jgi:ribosomal protein S18 acetylase RimI-like enzyme
MGDVVVREARAADAAQLGAVHVVAWQAAYRGLMPQDYLDGLDPAQRTEQWEGTLARLDPARGGVFVAETAEDQRLLGFSSCSASRDDDASQQSNQHAGQQLVGEIPVIYLLPESWGKGIGRRLMDTALQRLTDAGYTEATLWVLDTNTRARRFYEAGGWALDGAVVSDEIRGFPAQEVRYRKSLRGPEA